MARGHTRQTPTSVPGMPGDVPKAESESFEEFKNSFSYGSRSDLTFKFLRSLTAADAAEFFRLLLWEIGDSLDHGDISTIHRLVYEWQVVGYEGRGGSHSYEQAPFARPARPVAQSRVGVLTSSGHFPAWDDPQPFGVENMTQAEAEARIDEFLKTTPVLSAIPTDIAAEDLRVRHGGFDVRSVSRDPDVAFPLRTMLEFDAEDRIGALSSPLYSFTGATSQGGLRSALPGWIDRLLGDGIEVLLLVPV